MKFYEIDEASSEVELTKMNVVPITFAGSLWTSNSGQKIPHIETIACATAYNYTRTNCNNKPYQKKAC